MNVQKSIAARFYKHYQDVYDLMEKLENEAVEAFEKLLDSYVQNETVPALVTLLTSLRENRELLLPLLANSSNDDFMKRLTHVGSVYALSHLTPEEDYTSNQRTGGRLCLSCRRSIRNHQQLAGNRYTGASAAGCRIDSGVE